MRKTEKVALYKKSENREKKEKERGNIRSETERDIPPSVRQAQIQVRIINLDLSVTISRTGVWSKVADHTDCHLNKVPGFCNDHVSLFVQGLDVCIG